MAVPQSALSSDPGSPERPQSQGSSEPSSAAPSSGAPWQPLQRRELSGLRRELADFSRALRVQLRSHEQRQELLLAQLESAAEGRRCVISLDDGAVVQGVLDQAERSVQEKREREVETSGDASEGQASEPLSSTAPTPKWADWHKEEKGPRVVGQMSKLRTEAMRSEMGEGAWRIVGSCVDWWVELREPPKHGFLARCVGSKWFETLCTVMVALNCMLIVETTNYEALHLEENNSQWRRLVDIAFVVFYSLELLLRLLLHRIFFFCNEEASWNLFDFVLVAVAVLDLLYSEGALAVTHLRTARALRILRATKVLRIFRLMRFFSQLRLLLSSVLNSLVSLFWAVVMLAFMLFMFALTFVQGATSARMEGGLSDSQAGGLAHSLGSTQAGMLTLLQSTTGGEDWGRFYRLIQLTGEWNCGLFLFIVAFVQVALLNILTGIFVEHALKLAQPDRDMAALQQRKEELSEAEELRKLFASVDSHHSGVISEAQFMKKLQSDQFRARLALMGLEIKHAQLFFESVCTDFGRKEVGIEAFVAGAMRLKGHASALDLQTLTFGTKLIHENQLRFFQSVDTRLESIARQLGPAVS